MSNFDDKMFSFQYNYCNSPLQMIVALLVVLCMRATSPNPVPGLISPKIAVLTLPGNVIKTNSYHGHERVNRSAAQSSVVLDNVVTVQDREVCPFSYHSGGFLHLPTFL